MSSVIVAWVLEDTEKFERNIPLSWVGKRNLKLGSKNNINVIFLEGLERLTDKYVCQLKESGYNIINCNSLYEKYSHEYPKLNCFNDYEKKCFLRWLVIDDVFANEPIIHYDGDIVFNELPEKLELQYGNLSFVLQGCPAFVSTGKSDWLALYRNNLSKFVEDIEGYSEVAWMEREGWEKTYLEKWSGSRFRKIISSDQDFISHLIHTDRLPQESPKIINTNDKSILFENTLEFENFYAELLPIKYERKDHIDYFNGRKIAFWHMQTYFIYYLRLFHRRGALNKISRCKNELVEDSIEFKFWNKFDSYFRRQMNRSKIYDYFFNMSDFSGVFNDKVYWKKGVFR